MDAGDGGKSLQDPAGEPLGLCEVPEMNSLFVLYEQPVTMRSSFKFPLDIITFHNNRKISYHTYFVAVSYWHWGITTRIIEISDYFDVSVENPF